MTEISERATAAKYIVATVTRRPRILDPRQHFDKYATDAYATTTDDDASSDLDATASSDHHNSASSYHDTTASSDRRAGKMM